MTTARLEQLLVRALEYIDPKLLDLTEEEACYLGVPGEYTVPIKTAHWVNRGGGYECSTCGKWVRDREKTCPDCNAWMGW